MMENRNIIDAIALLLVIIGGINWGLVGLANTDLVAMLFGAWPLVAKIVYSLVGLSAVYVLLMFKKFAK
jgi:uncharacterized membrane protein YuzA (DUF378 family)